MKLLNQLSFLLINALVVLSLLGCTKSKDNPSPNASGSTGALYLHFHTYAGTEEVAAPNVVYDSVGRKISLSLAQLYLSNIQLVKLDGSTMNVANVKILKVMDQEVYLIGNVPAGNYKSINFSVGFDSTDNKKTASSLSDSILNKPEMWFGSQAQPDGYVFLNVQGMIDTSAAANAPVNNMVAFQYKIGTEANYRNVSMPVQNYSIQPGGTTYIHMYADYQKLFTGIQLNDINNLSVQSISDNGSSLAKKIADNIPSMFNYEN